MLIFVIYSFENTGILVIQETKEEKGFSVKQLKEHYTKYAYAHFIKNPPLVLLNQTTGWYIEVTTRVVREWWNKSRTRARILSIQLLDKMIETAVLLKTGYDEKNTPGIVSVSEFENRCKINDELYKIRIIVKKQPNRHFVYYYGAVNIEIQ